VETLAFALALLLINYCRVAKYYVAGLPKYRRSSLTKKSENAHGAGEMIFESKQQINVKITSIPVIHK